MSQQYVNSGQALLSTQGFLDVCNPISISMNVLMKLGCELLTLNTFKNILFTVDCGPPAVPQRGSLENHTDTTEGSEVFYRCDPGLVPAGRMRAVCTRNGWSPNPADLRCSVGML